MDATYILEIVKILGNGWYATETGIHNKTKNYHFYFHLARTSKHMIRFASAHNGENPFRPITETSWPSEETFPNLNIDPKRGAEAAARAITRLFPEVARLSAIVDGDLAQRAVQAENTARRVAELIELSGGRLGLKDNSENCFQVREIPNLDRLEVYQSTTLVGIGYTSMPDWKAKAILKVLMAETPENLG